MFPSAAPERLDTGTVSLTNGSRSEHVRAVGRPQPDVALEVFVLLCHLSMAIVDLSGNLGQRVRDQRPENVTKFHAGKRFRGCTISS
jgi:hypothetical protein